MQPAKRNLPLTEQGTTVVTPCSSHLQQQDQNCDAPSIQVKIEPHIGHRFYKIDGYHGNSLSNKHFGLCLRSPSGAGNFHCWFPAPTLISGIASAKACFRFLDFAIYGLSVLRRILGQARPFFSQSIRSGRELQIAGSV